MATKLEDKIDPAALYDEDFYAWAMHQAETLRRCQATRPNNLPLDFEHLIEEVEDLADNRIRIAQSQIRRLFQHLLKLEHSPADRPRRQWLNSVDDARNELRWAMTAAVRNLIAPAFDDLYDDARITAARDLLDHDEAEAAAILPDQCPYTLEQLLTKGWTPTNRHGLTDDRLEKKARP